MNRTFDDEYLNGSSKPADSPSEPVRRPWVKPVLERLSLKDALTSPTSTNNTDGPSTTTS